MKVFAFLSNLLVVFVGLPTIKADPISFSEFPIGTEISTQYADQGIVFSGDSPFITTDDANPTSPVLSGTPRFFGRITGKFVDPSDSSRPVVVQGFKIDAGYFDSIGSVRIEWFDKSGRKLGQRANSKFAIEKFEIRDSSGIASWSIGIFADEPAGYGIDNFELEPAGPTIIFREKKESDSFWYFVPVLHDEIPGWDHVGFQIDDLVYESHPEDPGTFTTRDGSEDVTLAAIDGVQAQHSAATFRHYSTTRRTKVTQLDELPIPRNLAESMRTYIEGRRASGAGFRFLKFNSLAEIDETMSPYAQKGGGDNRFTCVGLVEAAAEAAGHNGGQGFIRNAFESFTVETDEGPRVVPLLSPQLLHHAMRTSATINSVKQWFHGFFDPVDFLITDPIGRRLGFLPGLGSINEIPGAFFSGDGFFEQVLIPNPLPGEYQVKLVGKGKPATVAFGDADQSKLMKLASFRRNAPNISTHTLAAKQGVRGDLDNDSDVDANDLNRLRGEPNVFTDDPNDPRDINGDGVVSFADVLALDSLIHPPLPGSVFAGVTTTLKGSFQTRPPGGRKVRSQDGLTLSFGAGVWAATDLAGNESRGTWKRRNRAGTLVRLEFDDTTALETQILAAVRSSYREFDANVSLTGTPIINVTKTRFGRYKAAVKASYRVVLPSGAVKRARYQSMLKL